MNIELHSFFQAQIISFSERTNVKDIQHRLFPDKWIASSTMQKAIRRGDVSLALSAAAYLIEHDVRMCKRRIAITAVEDIGVADIWLVGLTQYSALRNGQLPTTVRYKALLACVEQMALSAKDRSADYIQTALEAHPSLDLLRDKLADRTPCQLKAIIIDEDSFLLERSLASWYLTGVSNAHYEHLPDMIGDRDLFTLAMEQLSVPYWMPFLTNIAGPSGKEPMFWHYPIKASHIRLGKVRVAEHKIPKAIMTKGIPHYALDSHTRLGKQAIRQLLKAHRPLTSFLSHHIPQTAWQPTVEGALFNVEAALVNREITFPEYESIKKLGIETDICRYGLPTSAMGELVALLLEALPLLDDIKRQILKRAL